MISRNHSWVLAALLLACGAHTNYEAQHLADGSMRLKCQGALPACIGHADDVCHGHNYEVVRARDQRDTYGPENGTSQIEVRSSEVIIRCGTQGNPLANVDITPTNDTPAAPPPSAPAQPPGVIARACVPGATQACIGPGRCEGGQYCLPDGSAFGPCDCGTLGPPPTAPIGPANTGTPTSIAPGHAGPAPSVPGAATPATPMKK